MSSDPPISPVVPEPLVSRQPSLPKILALPLIPLAVLGLTILAYKSSEISELWILCLPGSLIFFVACIWSAIRWVRLRRKLPPWMSISLPLILACTIVCGLVVIRRGHRELFGTPARFSTQHLLGMPATQIQQELGRPDYDSRSDPTMPHIITYTYGVGSGHGRLCKITFGNNDIAAKVENFDK